MAEIRSRVADHRTQEDHIEATYSVGQDSRASLKRASTSVLPDEGTESKRVNSIVEMEIRESRAECFRHREESPLSWWKDVVSKGDIAFFQAGFTDARRVSSFLYLLICVVHI